MRTSTAPDGQRQEYRQQQHHQDQREVSRSYPNLTHKYGEIGISAVVAAMRYQAEPRESERTPVYHDHQD